MNIIDICQEGLCMEIASALVTVSNGKKSRSVKVCSKHHGELSEKVARANQERGPRLILVTKLIARVA